MKRQFPLHLINILSLLQFTVFLPAVAAQTRRLQPKPAVEQAIPSAVHTLPLRRVVLYSNGVAYFERRGTVTGHAEINLSFKQSQVDDVLKSMVVLDLGHGRIGAVSYNSSAPASVRLGEIPFSMEARTEGVSGKEQASGLAGVLGQLQGARVAVGTGTRSVTGSILTVESRRSQPDNNKTPELIQTLVVASDGGEVISFDLGEVRSVRLLDPEARRDIGEFASASASARRHDAKTITVVSDGDGAREMVVSYTIAAPIWKTNYRVVLDSTGKPFFQGWAIVDNVSEEDWRDLSLSLVSGMPVSFIQPVQQPLYRYRPVIPIPDNLELEPQKYEPGTGVSAGSGMGSGSGGGSAAGGAGRAAVQVTGSSEILNSSASPAKLGPTTSLSDAIADGDSGVKTAATGAELGDLFEYKIDQPVTVQRDRSALIPILQTRMEGERVSIYNESARADRPMSGLRLKNLSPLTLEGGSITVVDGDAYAGEALMERLKPNEERFISFAVDLATLITLDSKTDRRPAFMARVVNGVFQAHYYRTEQKTYTLTNQTDRPRTVYVEHPIREGWALADGVQKPIERTQDFYRFKVELAPRATQVLPVIEREALMDTYQISNLTPHDVELFVQNRYLDDASRAALEKILDLKRRITELNQRLSDFDKETTEIGSDQARLRENIKALNETAEARQLISRYIAKAGEQESRIEQLTKDRKTAIDERARLQTELDNAIRVLALDRKL